MQPFDADDVVRIFKGGVEVAPVEDTRPDRVRARVVVQHNFVLERLLPVEHVWKRLVLDLDELGRVTRQLASAGNHGGDRIADVTHTADCEGVVLDVRAGRCRELEERIREDRDLVSRERPVHTVELERLRHVDGLDARMCIRRAHEVDETHLVSLDVVEEDPFALDEPLVFFPRDVLPDEADLRLAFLDDEWSLRSNRCLGHCAAALIASTMFT